jgi:ABC-type transport system substrate-binding protein
MRVRALTLAAIAALVFTACSSTPGATTAPTTGPTAAASAAASVPASAAAGGGQLNFTRLSDFPTCFHPICFQTGNQFMAFQLLFNTLVKRDQTEKIIPSLADSWDVSPDATTFTFHLNKNAKWHDGQAVTADDVVYTVTEGQKDADAYKANGTYPITAWLNTKTVEAVDPNTVKFTLSAPSAVFLDLITDPAYMIMPKHTLTVSLRISSRRAISARARRSSVRAPTSWCRTPRTRTSSSPRTRTTSRAHRRSPRSSIGSR